MVFVCFALLMSMWSAGAEDSELTPTLRIERQVWALDEDVFFWVGVRVHGRVEPEDIEGCGAEVVAPDGFRRWQPIYWPTDGNPQYGWSGGHGLPAAETEEGTYRVRVVCGGQTTEGSFEVRRMEILDEIDFRIEFEPGCREDPNDETILLVLENRSRFPVLVAPPGRLMMNDVSFEMRHRTSEFTCQVFVPNEALGSRTLGEGDTLVELLDWDNRRDVGVEPVSAGETYNYSFCLTDLRDEPCPNAWPPRFVRVSASTQVLVGPRDGPWADSGPFHFSASESRDVPPQLDLGEPTKKPASLD
ncbi:MAG: hypothetical protein MPN21_23965 [Thermoanaerobaculia bacterium]|nr:hypothetical protein [Thermoanaerobaculia bacterium]